MGEMQTSGYPVHVDDKEWIAAELRRLRVSIDEAKRGLPTSSELSSAASAALLAARNRNKINNGALQVNQRRVVSGVVLKPGEFGFDRWRAAGFQNLITNPSAEVNTTGATATACTLTRSNAWASAGWSLQLASPSLADSFITFSVATLPGRRYTVSGTARLTAALTGSVVGGARSRAIVALDGTNALATSPQVANVAGESRVSVSFDASSFSTNIRFYHGTTAGTIWWDALMVTEGDVLSPYFDGSTGGGAIWQGTAHASVSQSRASTTLTFTSAPQGQLVTIADGGSLVQVIPRADVLAEPSVFSWAGTATGRIFTHDAAGHAAPPALAASPITVTPSGTTDLIVQVEAVGAARTFGLAQFELGSVPTPFERLLFAEARTLALPELGSSVRGQFPSSVVLGSGTAFVAEDGTVFFSGATSVSLNDVFDGLGADVYVLYGKFQCTAAGGVFTRFRTAGVDNSTAAYNYVAQSTINTSGPTRASIFSTNLFGLWSPNIPNAAATMYGQMRITDPGRPSPTFIRLNSEISTGDRTLWDEMGNAPLSINDGVSVIATAGNLTGWLKAVKIA